MLSPFRNVRIRSYEKGLVFRDGEFIGVLGPGRHWRVDPLFKTQVEVVSAREPWLRHSALDLMVKSGLLGDDARVVDLKDNERGLVWIDGRFEQILLPGLHVLWTNVRDVRVEIADASRVRFEHSALATILKSDGAAASLSVHTTPEGQLGLIYVDGAFSETVPPGQYAFWKDLGTVRFFVIDRREAVLDVSGQELMTADKVTLRLNAIVTYRVRDAQQAVNEVEDFRQALYRDAQLSLRAVVGTRELDQLLTDKDAVARELEEGLRERAAAYGIELVNGGIRDIILPGDMKELLNKVTEAKKAAEASLITRREETAAMRSQANTARLLQDNPTLMRLRELEVLEKVAETSKLNVVLGEKGLADSVLKLV